tara:strand:+ start:632 stop:1033 length:402 start_codon:yes stop_codon:yes gene_type:complete
MNEKQNYEINEQLVKEALVSVSQNRVLELTSQNLLLQANYQVLLAECQNFPQVLNEVEMLRGKLSELTEKSVEELEQAQQEQLKLEASHEHIRTDMQNMVNKIDTFYKPRIRELENEVEELKELLPEDKKSKE